MNKIKKISYILYYLLAFLIPFIILVLIYYSQNIYYGGISTILTSDLQGQYMPFITGIRYLVEDPSRMLFNWNYSLGGNYMGVVAYYLASPLNLITLLWKIEDMPDAIYILELTKIALCGLTFAIFLRKKNKSSDIRFSNLVFSTCYALMSYNIVYGMNLMWLDAIILLPIVILGIDNILEGKKGGIYLVSMIFVFITNYYMAYIIGVFVATYFVLKMYLKKGWYRDSSEWRKIGGFIINTILALMLSMPVVLPALLNAKYRYAGGNLLETADEYYQFQITDLLRKFLPSMYDTIFNEGGRPYIFCGSVILLLAIIYFFQKRTVREKILNLILLLFIFSGFLFQGMDYFWHGLRYPHAFPYRYAFLFSFMVLLLGYEAFLKIPFDMKYVNSIWILCVLYTFMEMYMNGTAMVSGIFQQITYDNRMQYDLQHEEYTPIAEQIKQESDFYRMKNDLSVSEININASAMYGLNGTNYFSSSSHNAVAMFFENMGSEDILAMISSRGFTPLMDSMMGIKYCVAKDNPMGLYEEINQQEHHMKLYENPYALGWGFLIPEDSIDREDKWSEDPFENQKQFLEFLGVKNSKIYKEIPLEMEKVIEGEQTLYRISFQCISDNPVCYYLNCDIGGGNSVIWGLDDEIINVTYQMDTKRIYVKQGFQKGEEHVFQIIGKTEDMMDFYLYEFDKDAYFNEIQNIKENSVYDMKNKGNHISGRINLQKSGILLTTLAYDEGYTVYVDGIKTDYQKIFDTFIGVKLDAGEHKIEFVYMPPGLIAGIWIMIAGAVLSIGYYGLLRMKSYEHILN